MLELRAHREDELVQLDWWYDTRSFDRYTVEELAEQLPFTLIELTSEAMPAGRIPRWPSATDSLDSITALIRPSPGSLRKNSSRRIGLAQ